MSRLQPPPAARLAVAASSMLILGTVLGACSADHEARRQDPAWAGVQPPAPAPQKQAAYEPAPGDPIKDAPIEPRRAPNAQPDDPKEPFSPNYGAPRNRPPVTVSDASPATRDPEPDRPTNSRRLPEPSRAYFKRVTTATASAD